MYKNIGMPEAIPDMLEIVRDLLDSNDISYNVNKLEHGTQLILTCGLYVNVYKTGTVQVQGKKTNIYKEKVKQILGIN